MENQTASLCNCCYNAFNDEDIFCNSCGYPLQGTQQEQDTHIVIRANKEIDIAELNGKVASARNSLYWIGGIIGVWAVITYFVSPDADEAFSLLITNVILVGAFLSFGVWSKSKPTTALISGLALYLIVQILNAIVSPMSIFSGIIMKVIIIAYLIKGIKAVLEIDKLKKELNIN